MNNKQFLTELSGKCQMSAEQAAQQIQTLIGVMENLWQNGDSVSLSGFGVLEVKKKNEFRPNLYLHINPVQYLRKNLNKRSSYGQKD